MICLPFLSFYLQQDLFPDPPEGLTASSGDFRHILILWLFLMDPAAVRALDSDQAERRLNIFTPGFSRYFPHSRSQAPIH